MNSKQIASVLSADICARRVFQGVFPRDKLPNIISKPSIFVINTDTSDGPGLHWVVVNFDAFGYAEYFDSFGIKPLYADIVHFIENNIVRPYTYNNRVLQDLTSTACGWYVLYYVLMKTRGQSLAQILRPFSSRYNYMNDKIVYYRVKQLKK